MRVRFISRGLVSSEATSSDGATDIQNKMEAIFANARVCRRSAKNDNQHRPAKNDNQHRPEKNNFRQSRQNLAYVEKEPRQRPKNLKKSDKESYQKEVNRFKRGDWAEMEEMDDLEDTEQMIRMEEKKRVIDGGQTEMLRATKRMEQVNEWEEKRQAIVDSGNENNGDKDEDKDKDKKSGNIEECLRLDPDISSIMSSSRDPKVSEKNQ